MLISELEVLGTPQAAVRQTALKLRIADVGWKSGEELLTEIAARDQAIHEDLRAFINAYIDWFRFHKRIEQQGRHGHLDENARAELARLVRDRNRAREDILARLAMLT